MDMFSKITIAHFIWYLVPGLALVFFFLFPFVILEPHLAKHLFDSLGPVGVVLLAIIFGFSLDGLRLYRLRADYDQTKKTFFDDLKKVLAVDLDPYFIQSHISEVVRLKEVSGLGIHHAIWIMHGHFAALALLESIFWIITAVYFYLAPFFRLPGKSSCPLLIYSIPTSVGVWIYLALSLVFFLLGLRFQKISIEDQKTTNKMFLHFAEQHKTEILQKINA